MLNRVRAAVIATMPLILSACIRAAPDQPDLDRHFAWGGEVDGLRLGIFRDPSNGEDRPIVEFRVALQNVGEMDLMLNLGMMLANGKTQYASAVKLIISDSDGNEHEFWNNQGRVAGVAGRIDPFVVPLPAGCTYVLRVDLDNYWPGAGESSPNVDGGDVRAEFEGREPANLNLDSQGIGLMTYWLGSVGSGRLDLESK